MVEQRRATDEETIQALLDTSPRHAVPLENAFVRRRTRTDVAPPLSRFVKARRERTLRQYLLLHAVTSDEGRKQPPWSSTRDSRVWARAMRMDDRLVTARSAVSKNWEWLEKERLVARTRSGRLATVQLRKDDGSGDEYARPKGNFFRLPYRYWRDGWDAQLALDELAILLVALSLPPTFRFDAERDRWQVDLSKSFIAGGLRGLTRRGILSFTESRVTAPLAPAGVTVERQYSLSQDWQISGSKTVETHDDAKA